MAAQMYTRLRSVVAYCMFGCWFTQEISLRVPQDKAEGRTSIGDGLDLKYVAGDRERGAVVGKQSTRASGRPVFCAQAM